MSPSIVTTLTQIWKKLKAKEYRDSYVAAHVSNTVASQINMLREQRGWTQKELAQRASMSQSRISALEDPNYENIEVGTLKRLASAFDVALTVRFTPFSELATWTANLSEDKLLIADFANDVLPQAAKTAELFIAFADYPSASPAIDYPWNVGVGSAVWPSSDFNIIGASRGHFTSGNDVITAAGMDNRRSARPSTQNVAVFGKR